ncbi:MAG: 5-methylthioadenosine phosphorylase [Myxococcaceae bacterium]|nr:5-methylthioadenosine phosphorylase [Myxococcaceae bacterium]
MSGANTPTSARPPEGAPREHHIGVIGGSGLYAMASLTDVREEMVRTPFGDPSDGIVIGDLGPTRFYFLPRHGRGHRIPPSRVNYRANLYALKMLGAQQVVSVSAVGSLREDVHPGEVVLVDQYIDRTRSRVGTFFDEAGVVAHVSLADPTDAALTRCLADALASTGAKVHPTGTYLCMEGPQFSTRAESRLYRSWGADIIGMTGMPEAKLAREAELPYASMALVTDYDCWHESEADVSVDEVLSVMAKNVAIARSVLHGVARWPDPSASPSASALAHALITEPQRVTLQTRERLALLIGKYLPSQNS